MKNKNIVKFKPSVRDLKRLAAMCSAFSDIERLCSDNDMLSNDEIEISYLEICRIIREFGEEWGT